MKKLAAMLLTFVGTVIFAACGGARTDSNEQPKVRTDQPVSARQLFRPEGVYKAVL